MMKAWESSPSVDLNWEVLSEEKQIFEVIFFGWDNSGCPIVILKMTQTYRRPIFQNALAIRGLFVVRPGIKWADSFSREPSENAA